jgi:hypothetical protein
MIGDVIVLDQGTPHTALTKAKFTVSAVDGSGNVTAATLTSGGTYDQLPARLYSGSCNVTGTVAGHPAGDVGLTITTTQTPDPGTGLLTSGLGCSEPCAPPYFRVSLDGDATSTTLRFKNCGAADVFLKPNLTFTMTLIRGGIPVVYTASLILVRPCYDDALYVGILTPNTPTPDCFGNAVDGQAYVTFTNNPAGGPNGCWSGDIFFHDITGTWNPETWFTFTGGACPYTKVVSTFAASGFIQPEDANACVDYILSCYPGYAGPCAGVGVCGLAANVAAKLLPDDPTAAIPWSIA